MGQGIISRSNPGNSGDKVGDIKITTRNTLGEKWALCNGSIYEGETSILKDPLNENSWRDLGIDFESESFQKNIGLIDETYNNSAYASNTFIKVIKGSRAHYIVYHIYIEGPITEYASIYRHVLIAMTFDSEANPKFEILPAYFDFFSVCIAIAGVDNNTDFIINDDDRLLQCTGCGMNGIVHAVFDMDTGNLINYYHYTSKNYSSNYESGQILACTKNKTLVYLTENGGVCDSIHLCTPNGITTIDTYEASCYQDKFYASDYVNDTMYIYLDKGGSPFNTSIFINKDNSLISVDGVGYYKENCGSPTIECLIDNYLIFSGPSGCGIGCLTNTSDMSKTLSFYSEGSINSVYVFIDRANNLMIIQPRDYGSDEEILYTGVFTGSEANLEFIYNNAESLQERFANTTDIRLVSGDYTNDSFYFRAKGDNSICLAKLPEISVDDESYCFIKIKD